jgi:hypothetical protein
MAVISKQRCTLLPDENSRLTLRSAACSFAASKESQRRGTIIVAKAEQKRVAEERERAGQAMWRRRELARLRAEREDKKSVYLGEIAAARRKVVDLQTTIEAIRQADNLPADYARMIGWAKERLAELEARTTVEAIQATLREENFSRILTNCSTRREILRRDRITGTID